MQDKKFTERLKQRLTIEFQNQDRSGAYGFTQRSMAYNSNKIEGSTLTEKQTASLFDTGTFFADDEDTIFRAKDVEEMNGHFKMFNYMMKHAGEPLTADIIKGMHKNLKEGVFEDMANGYAVGDWKKRANLVGDITTALPQEVPAMIEALLAEYTGKKKVELRDIAKFHAVFENIHPFQDGNGRVGRMILLKQCLDADITPVIIRDENKIKYYRYLSAAQNKRDYASNIVHEYATKRYRSNVMNWGMVPFQMEAEPSFEVGDYVFVPGIRAALDGDLKDIAAYVVRADGAVEQIELYIADMTAEERAIVKAGCLINYNKFKAAAE